MINVSMSNRNRSRRSKSFEVLFKELVDELEMLESDLLNFERSNRDLWVRSAAGRLHKLVVERRNNTPLLIDLAKSKNYPLTVYVFNAVISDLRAKDEGRPVPIASVIPNILSLDYDPWYSYPKSLQDAIKLPCIIWGGEGYSFENILMAIRDTEGHHSDPGRPESLDTLDRIVILNYSSAYMATYHLGKIILAIGKRFVFAITKNNLLTH